MIPPSIEVVKAILRDPVVFAEYGNGLKLRRYQQPVLKAIVNSVHQRLGLTFVVLFPRQSGKNELQAQLESYLLTCYSNEPAEIVKVSPTWKPQSQNAMRRLERVLKRSLLLGRIPWHKEQGYIYQVGSARMAFLSGGPAANVVGATASTLLECDEAQDVLADKWDKEINPMAASTNATRVFWGTAWTSQTLLARELRAAQEAERLDGVQRVFRLSADEVGQEAPAYKTFVENEIRRMGRQHPFIRTQYFSEEIDAEGGMFPAGRIALMRGGHPVMDEPQKNEQDAQDRRDIQDHLIYAFLIDVGGEDRDATPNLTVGRGWSETSPHDSTVLTCILVDLSTLSDPVLQGPTYRAVQRRVWTGASQATLYAQLHSLVETWQPQCIVIDATGIGAGLAAFLEKNFGRKVTPFIFTHKSKSDLAWDFLAVIETGRYKEYTPFDAELLRQLQACQLDILPGPGRLCHWGVPDGTRDPLTGELVHDDLVLSAALVARLDQQTWGRAESAVIQASNPIQDLSF
jgi:hypothetical protein